MANKPIELRVRSGRTFAQRLWEIVRKHREAFTVAFLARTLRCEEDAVWDHLRRWVAGGYVLIKEKDATGLRGVACRHTYHLVRDVGVEAPRCDLKGKPCTQGSGTEAMWTTMRILADFNADELVAHASTRAPVRRDTAIDYIKHLSRAGYLQIVREERSLGFGKGRVAARYRLAPRRDTGPRPPMIKRTKAVFDPNLGKVVWQQPILEEEEEAAHV